MSQDSSILKAGAAKIDITPKVGCWLEGIPRAEPSDSIHDPLHARALVVDAKGTRICLVVCDLIGVTTEFADDVRRRIAQAIGTLPANVTIACAHNHSGPAMLGIIDGPDNVDNEYLKVLASKLLVVSQEAAYRLEPALLGAGRGEETTVSEYRRLFTKDGSIVMNWEEYPQEDIVGPAEEGDPELGVVKIVAEDGHTIAVIFNYACHPNSMPGDNFTITSDFPGYAAAMIEEEMGGIALFTNGAQGSVDIEGIEGRDFEGVTRRGKALGQAVLEVCQKIEIQPDSVIGCISAPMLLPYRKISPETLDWARGIASKATGEAVTLRDGISDEMKADNVLWLDSRSEPGVTFELVAYRLGQAAFVTIQGEPFTEIGKRVKDLSKSLQVYVVALANGYYGYISTAKASSEGGYATDVASGAYYTENAEDIICQSAKSLLDDLQ